MISTAVDVSARRLAIGLIDVYRQRLSAHKGFACPHRLLYGESCSGRIRRAFTDQNLLAAVQSAAAQFGDCSRASAVLRERNRRGNVRCIVIPCCFPI
ncbi:membrane protein insertion efficiency factor YidD [Gloeobacter violaceus]|uniref:Gsr2518 protein n=1 Tax=Gloeobacter violaceus (strain ATCC 29082 / PCC 7421) TaxID=251221 RepID=Q7NHL7_GLOVI|nr:membrane protein insertion efficiency factor YidD [Gloeobacter violaceus]BAC90459.1 gsr2518 [Gloeobacter violaceus PCC 7421]